MIRHEMIELLGWRYQDMTEAQQDVLSRVENIVEVAVLRERYKTICAAELLRLQAQRDALLEALREIVDAADGTGWDQLDASFSKARAAIEAVEGEKE